MFVWCLFCSAWRLVLYFDSLALTCPQFRQYRTSSPIPLTYDLRAHALLPLIAFATFLVPCLTEQAQMLDEVDIHIGTWWYVCCHAPIFAHFGPSARAQ